VSYELRRLRLHGLIERIEGTHRYRLTRVDAGRVCSPDLSQRLLDSARKPRDEERPSDAENRQFLRSVRTEHEDPLDIAGSAWTGDE
jgi:hypothetical protein